MRLGLNLATIMTTPLPAALEAARAAGFALVELRAPALAGLQPAEVAARMAGAGLQALSVNAVEGFDAPGSGAEEEFRRQAQWAAALGGAQVLVVPVRAAAAAERTDRLQRAAEAVARLEPVARAAGVRMAVEFLGFADSTVRSLAEAAQVAAASPLADLVLDTFHLGLQGGPLPGAPAGRLAIVHLADLRAGVQRGRATDADRCLPGEGSLGIAATLARLAAAGYDGPASVELFDPVLWGQDPLAVAARAFAAADAALPVRGAGAR